MSIELLETIKQQISQLDLPEQSEIERYLRERGRSNGAPSQMPPDIAERERKRRLRAEWLKAHGEKYAGLYVALDGDQLLGAGKNYPEAFEAAKRTGVNDAYVDFVYPADYEGEMLGGW